MENLIVILEQSVSPVRSTRQFRNGVYILLVTKGAGKRNLLLAGCVLDLEGTVLEEVLDRSRQWLVLLDVVLVLNLTAELGRQLLVDLAGGSAAEKRRGEGGCLSGDAGRLFAEEGGCAGGRACCTGEEPGR